ncbi:MAG: hypothetical protein C0394_01320 [Syntrophus sp. (in: bacteria)]|nr:hypothetical protein [Syntrophus sp. (in: bacteria)]
MSKPESFHLSNIIILDAFVKSVKFTRNVIPAKAGIQTPSRRVTPVKAGAGTSKKHRTQVSTGVTTFFEVVILDLIAEFL